MIEGEQEPVSHEFQFDFDLIDDRGTPLVWDYSYLASLDGKIEEWLGRLTNDWRGVDRSSIRTDELDALRRLTASGLVEQRLTLEVRDGASSAVALVNCHGSGDLEYALYQELEKRLPTWQITPVDICPSAFDVRLTAEGAAARADLRGSNELLKANVFGVVRGFTPAGRAPAEGTITIASLAIADPSTSNSVNRIDPSTNSGSKKKRLTIDDRMAGQMNRHPEAMHDWSAARFATAVGMSKTTVAESRTWKNIQAAREAEKERRLKRSE